ncbi:unnamed protein product, partial [marine sediment metagenome]
SWELIINSEDFNVVIDPDDKYQEGGAMSMSKTELEKTDGEEEVIEEEEVTEEEVVEEVVETPEVEEEDTDKVNQLELDRTALKDAQEEIRALKEERLEDKSLAMVKNLIAKGHLRPAQGKNAYALILQSLRTTAKVRIHDEDEEGKNIEEDKDAVEVLLTLIKENSPKIETKPRALTWEGSDNPDNKLSDPEAKEAAEEIYALTE